jgi:tetratricopeptide (TPR) repeat protein
VLYRRAMNADPDALWAVYGLGWSLQHVDPPRLEEAEEMYRKALDLEPSDMWVRKGLANVRHMRGDRDGAREMYEQLLVDVQRLRTERPDALEVAGWCAFRVGDLNTASRIFLEVLSAETRISASHFDFALVQFCDPDIDAGLDLYSAAVEQLQQRNAHVQRGLVVVALGDFRQALRDFPEAASSANAPTVEQLLVQALDRLPDAPRLSALRQDGQVAANERAVRS